MAWIMPVPPSRRHARERFQVAYRDKQGHQRPGGIYTTRRAAEGVKRRLDHGEGIESIRGLSEEPVTDQKSLIRFGDYVTTRGGQDGGTGIRTRPTCAANGSRSGSCRPSEPAVRRSRRRRHRRLEGQDDRRGACPADHQRLSVPVVNHPQCGGRQRLPSPLPDAAQEPGRPPRRSRRSGSHAARCGGRGISWIGWRQPSIRATGPFGLRLTSR
jgi:hypothetical protein